VTCGSGERTPKLLSTSPWREPCGITNTFSTTGREVTIGILFRAGDRGSRRQARLVRRTSEIITHLGEVLDGFTEDTERLSREQATALLDAIGALEDKLTIASARLGRTRDRLR